MQTYLKSKDNVRLVMTVLERGLKRTNSPVSVISLILEDPQNILPKQVEQIEHPLASHTKLHFYHIEKEQLEITL